MTTDRQTLDVALAKAKEIAPDYLEQVIGAELALLCNRIRGFVLASPRETLAPTAPVASEEVVALRKATLAEAKKIADDEYARCAAVEAVYKNSSDPDERRLGLHLGGYTADTAKRISDAIDALSAAPQPRRS